MNVGMLWLDADAKRSFPEKVQRAVDYYIQKYGRSPDICLVNPRTLEKSTIVGDIKVEPLSSVLPHHFWLGQNNS